MQNVGQSENRNIDKVNVQLDVVKSSTPQSSASSPAKSETETYSGAPAKYMTDSSESEDDSVSEVKRVLFSTEAVALRECDYLYRSKYYKGHLVLVLSKHTIPSSSNPFLCHQHHDEKARSTPYRCNLFYMSDTVRRLPNIP